MVLRKFDENDPIYRNAKWYVVTPSPWPSGLKPSQEKQAPAEKPAEKPEDNKQDQANPPDDGSGAAE